MKALLVTIFRVPNYGSVLQAYATQLIIERMGCECKILNYNHNNSKWSLAHGVKKQSLKNKIGRMIGFKPHHRKANKLNQFIHEHLHLTPSYFGIEDIEKGENGLYDKYIVGSDQVWNTRFTNGDPVFLLDFVKDNKGGCYSLSSSFSSKDLSPNYKEVFKNKLCKFQAISVRELNGIEILRSLGIYKASLIYDPTLLLAANEWRGLIKWRKEMHPHKYILLYMCCYAFEPRPIIFEILKHYQKELNCNIIALEGFADCKDAAELNIADATDSSVSDFFSLFSNASIVITSSFHGTAFALNFGRPLISITPNNGDDRQSSLLRSLNLLQCRLEVNGDIQSVRPYYDVEQAQTKLDKIRKKCIKWINDEILKN